MASKLAAATLVEGNFTDEGLASMSDCTDMTSQLARELTMGIKDEVEDVAAMFKKMAVIKDDTEPEEDKSGYIIDDDSKKQDIMISIDTEITISVAEKLKRAMLLAMQATNKHMVNSMPPNVYIRGGQLSLFDMAS